MPPSSTGRTSRNPRRASSVAATAARTPELQTVATGRVGVERPRDRRARARGTARRRRRERSRPARPARARRAPAARDRRGRRRRSTWKRSSVAPAGSPPSTQRHAVEADGREQADRVGALRLRRREDRDLALGIEHEPGAVREAGDRDRDADRAGEVPAATSAAGRTSSELRVVRNALEPAGDRLVLDERPAVQLDDARHRRRLRREVRRSRGARTRSADISASMRVVPPLEAERGGGARRHRASAERAGDVPGEHLDAVAEARESAVQRAVEALGALARRRPRGRAARRRRRTASRRSGGSTARRCARGRRSRCSSARAGGPACAARRARRARGRCDRRRRSAATSYVGPPERMRRDPGAERRPRARRDPRRGRRACASR